MQVGTVAIYAKGAVAATRTSTFALVLILSVIVVHAANTLPENIPGKLRAAVDASAFKASFDVGSWLNPFYLRGDFDGDGLPDYALLVTRHSDGKRGIAVWLSTRHQIQPTMIGAGKKSRAGAGDEDDWDFFDAWQVYDKGIVQQGAGDGKPPKLIGDAILIEKTEAASGIVFWDGKQFRWYQQAD
jgi:hypothetical protein